MLTDAHIHMYDLAQRDPGCWETLKKAPRKVMVSHYCAEEHLYYLEKRRQGYDFSLSLGIHPQEPLWTHGEILIQALKEGSLRAIGECGYEFYLSRTPEQEALQDEIFLFQVQLGIQYGLPLVIHLRKGVDKIFEHLKVLKRLPGVVFHSWPGPLREAQSLLKAGLNAWFSFGNPLRQGNKKALECAANLPLDRILLETDAPWQTLKNEKFTPLEALEANYALLSDLRCLDFLFLEQQISDNFHKAYNLMPGK